MIRNLNEIDIPKFRLLELCVAGIIDSYPRAIPTPPPPFKQLNLRHPRKLIR